MIMNQSESQYDNKQLDDKCSICASTDSVVEYSFAGTAKDSSTVELCMEHKQLFKILDQPDSPSPARSVNREAQQTQKVTARIPKPLIEAADTTAETQGQTRSELMRDALQIYVELQEINSAADDLLSQAAKQNDGGTQADNSGEDTEFLKQRIRRLESLLEDSIEKI